MKTNELTGAALDWAVAKAIGEYKPVAVPSYSTDWAQGGPIIEREISKLFRNVGGTYTAQIKKEIPIPEEDRGTSLATHYTDWCNKAGPTPLIAAMRCYVASKLGDNIDIPKELTS